MVKGAGKIGGEPALASVEVAPPEPALAPIPAESSEPRTGVVSVILTAPEAKLGWLREVVFKKLASQHTVDFTSPENDHIEYVKSCFAGGRADQLCISQAGIIMNADYLFIVGGKRSGRNSFDVTFVLMEVSSAKTLVSYPIHGTKKEITFVAQNIVTENFGVKQKEPERAEPVAPPPQVQKDEYIPPIAVAAISPPAAVAEPQLTVEAPPAPDTFWPKWQMPVIFAGTAAIAGATGGVLGFMTSGKEKAAQSATMREEAFQHYDQAKTFSYATNAAFALTAVLTGIGTYFLIDSATEEDVIPAQAGIQ